MPLTGFRCCLQDFWIKSARFFPKQQAEINGNGHQTPRPGEPKGLGLWPCYTTDAPARPLAATLKRFGRGRIALGSPRSPPHPISSLSFICSLTDPHLLLPAPTPPPLSLP